MSPTFIFMTCRIKSYSQMILFFKFLYTYGVEEIYFFSIG